MTNTEYRIYTQDGVITENSSLEEIQNAFLFASWDDKRDYFAEMTDEQANDKLYVLEMFSQWIEDGDECHASCR